MKKKIITMLIALMAIVGKGMAEDLPIVPSTDTGDGAVWYYIQWNCGENDGLKCFTPNGLNEPLGIHWGDPNPDEEKLLYCFIGDNTGGFEIYNKAYLAGKTVDGVTLAEDVKLRNIPPRNEGGWEFVGFTLDATVEQVYDKWIIGGELEGAGTGERIMLTVDREKGWWRSGASECELGGVVDWEGAYAAAFTWVSGGDDPNPPGPEPELPFLPSENTGDGANWYYIFWDTDWGARPLYARLLDTGLSVEWGNPVYEEEKLLFCFIGNETDGFEIYNKAYLNGKTVPTDDEGGTIVLTEDLKIQNVGEEYELVGFSLNKPSGEGELKDKWYVRVGASGEIVEGRAVEGKTLIYANEDTSGAWWLNGASQLEWCASSGWGGAFALNFTPGVPLDNYTREFSPADGATGASLETPVSITFNNNIALGKYMSGNDKLITVTANGGSVNATPSVNENVFTLAIEGGLQANTTYSILIEPGVIIPFVTGDENKISWTFTTETGLGLGEIQIAENNPVISLTGKVVSVLSPETVTVQVYSASGSLVKETTAIEFTLEPGFYIIKAGEEVKKVMINR